MSGSLNKVMLIGNIGQDPETRTMSNGGKLVTFSLATSENWKDANGERQSRTEWHRCVCFNEKLGEIIERYVKKGSQIYIEGQIQTRKWQDQSGADRYSTEVVIPRFGGALTLLGSRDGGGGQRGGGAPISSYEDGYGSTPSTKAQKSSTSDSKSSTNNDSDDFGEDIPF